MYQVKKSPNMHFRQPQLNRGISDFQSGVFQMFHHRFANTTRVMLCKYNKYKLENMKNEPNNSHIPYITCEWGVYIWGITNLLIDIKVRSPMKCSLRGYIPKIQLLECSPLRCTTTKITHDIMG
jgi:hypothetical protein